MADLFISVYVNGSGYDKAIQIYNPTDEPIDLSDYYLSRVVNGGSNAEAFAPLSGIITAGDSFTIVHPSASNALMDYADAVSTKMNFTGDDHVILMKDSPYIGSGQIVDLFGTMTETGLLNDPGLAWVSGEISTAERILVRNKSQTEGDIDGFGADNADLGAQWTRYEEEDFAALDLFVPPVKGVENETTLIAYPTLDRALHEAADGDVLTVTGSGNFSLEGPHVVRADGLTFNATKASVFNAFTVATGANSFTANGDMDLHVRATNGDKSIKTDAGDDTLVGTNGIAVLDGGEGDNYFDGGDDGLLDIYIAGSGNDRFMLADGEGSDQITDTGGDDFATVKDEVGTRIIMDAALTIERVLGSHGGDDVIDASEASGSVRIYGRDGDDALTGSAYNDYLIAGRGYDRLEGGAGNDRLYGSDGEETYVFAASGDGDDWVVGFTDGEDRIQIGSDNAVSFEDLTIVERGAHLYVYYGEGDLIRMTGANANGVILTEADFTFG
ncbi:MAG: lamin tail domain-containing protein [Neomegalonema sp.]|nr:lamin tail domain-containing protein [Neomegalonema sp.]